MQDSLWFTTRSRLFEPGDAAWEEVIRYEAPLRRLLALRYARQLGPEAREDLLQDVLLEIKQSLAGRFDRSRGRFRALLQTVLRRRVVDELRRKQPEALTPAQAESLFAAEEVADLDLEAALVGAVEATRDHFSGGRGKDLDALHALVDRLVHGLSSVEIARRNGVSRDRVSRLLAKGRAQIFRALLARELGLEPSEPGLELAADAFRRMLREPPAARRILDGLGDEALGERLEAFWGAFRAALPRFAGDESQAGRELSQGVGLILDEEG